MADLFVTPDHLSQLAAAQDQASSQATTAASAADGVETAVWISHGVASSASNVAFTAALDARKAFGEALSTAATQLADKLRVATELYRQTDEEAAGELDKQILLENGAGSAETFPGSTAPEGVQGLEAAGGEVSPVE
ncbi:ESX-1 secretion-associated protein, partial [Mycobacterium sp. 050134]|uniref:ESX-1 secretion-associated protein n=1 Tax=Mycobacterium sp. 050134 TaxID=3096111 RepID=UPI002EDB7B3F